MTALESHTPSFIFRDEDFAIDQEEFDAAAFVTRFRRVTPLESLREQLVAYSNHVRKQLYVIINRDYKDFITIATKVSLLLLAALLPLTYSGTARRPGYQAANGAETTAGPSN